MRRWRSDVTIATLSPQKCKKAGYRLTMLVSPMQSAHPTRADAVIPDLCRNQLIIQHLISSHSPSWQRQESIWKAFGGFLRCRNKSGRRGPRTPRCSSNWQKCDPAGGSAHLLRTLGLNLQTVHKYLTYLAPPQRGHIVRRIRVLDPYQRYLLGRNVR